MFCVNDLTLLGWMVVEWMPEAFLKEEGEQESFHTESHSQMYTYLIPLLLLHNNCTVHTMICLQHPNKSPEINVLIHSPVKIKGITWRNVNPFTNRSEEKGISDTILFRTMMKRKKNTNWEALFVSAPYFQIQIEIWNRCYRRQDWL